MPLVYRVSFYKTNKETDIPFLEGKIKTNYYSEPLARERERKSIKIKIQLIDMSSNWQ